MENNNNLIEGLNQTIKELEDKIDNITADSEEEYRLAKDINTKILDVLKILRDNISNIQNS